VAFGFPAHAQAFATRFIDTQISDTVVAIDDPNAALGAIELGNIVLVRFAFDPDLAGWDLAPGSGDSRSAQRSRIGVASCGRVSRRCATGVRRSDHSALR